MYGAGSYCTMAYGAVLDLDAGPAWTAPARLRDAPADLQVPAPYLQLYELETTAGVFHRVVDYADPHTSGTAGTVTYDGDEYTSIKVLRAAISDTTESRLPELTVTVLDYNRALSTFIDANDVLNAKVTLTIIREDLLSDTTQAITRVFRLRQIAFAEGPSRVIATLGAPTLFSRQFPNLLYNRTRCHNEFHNRFVHDGVTNNCSYPSDEFEWVGVIKQVGQTPAASEQESPNNWFYQNGNEFDNWARSGALNPAWPAATDRALWIEDKRADMRWSGANRNGLFVYKKLGDIDAGTDDTDFDVRIKMEMAASLKDEWMVGILCQRENDPTDWVFWGRAENSSAVEVYRKRVTDASSSTTTDFTDTGHEAFRLVRSGSSWTFYTRSESVTGGQTFDDTTAWTQQTTDTLAMSGVVRVGIVACADVATGDNDVEAYIYHFRFYQGGAASCNRSLSDCQARKNTTQFNGFLGMPDGITFLG